MSLLAPHEPPPVRVLNEQGGAPFLLTADHAGRMIPASLRDLGVPARELTRHIAWDIGIAEVTERLSVALDAAAVLQTYSRLVIDCNRNPGVATAFPTVSEVTRIPGNEGLGAAEKLARRQAIFDPYHDEIARIVGGRRGRRTIYVAMHSFTPTYLERVRNMQVAVRYNRNARFSSILARLLRDETDLVVAENDPYRLSDETDYGVPVIMEEAGQVAWATRLARLLPLAAARLAEAAP